MVATGAALGCVSRHAVAAALADGTLVELNTGLPPLARRLAIVVHKDKQLGRGASDFLRHCNMAPGNVNMKNHSERSLE